MSGLFERQWPCGCSTSGGACDFHGLSDGAECAECAECKHPKGDHEEDFCRIVECECAGFRP